MPMGLACCAIEMMAIGCHDRGRHSYLQNGRSIRSWVGQLGPGRTNELHGELLPAWIPLQLFALMWSRVPLPVCSSLFFTGYGASVVRFFLDATSTCSVPIGRWKVATDRDSGRMKKLPVPTTDPTPPGRGMVTTWRPWPSCSTREALGRFAPSFEASFPALVSWLWSPPPGLTPAFSCPFLGPASALVGSKERPLHFLHRRRYLSPPSSSRSGDLLNA